MYHCLRYYLFLVYCINFGDVSILEQKLVYNKDISELCRRRALPSVFLGRSISYSNAKILYFSRLALPYSCFISVRTELGSNIILVIQVASEDNLLQSCSRKADQLKIYELSETFGGYWGPLPDSVLRPPSTIHSQFYTLQTTRRTTTPPILSSRDTQSSEEMSTRTEQKFHTQASDTEGGFIRYEVPLLNVSAKLVPRTPEPTRAFDIEDIFDNLYDVTPRRSGHYNSRVVPLLQFSMAPRRVTSFLRSDDGDQIREEPGFTPDSRLSIIDVSRSSNTSMIVGKPFRKMNRNRNSFLKFKKYKTKVTKPQFYVTNEYFTKWSMMSTIPEHNVRDDSIILNNYLRKHHNTTVTTNDTKDVGHDANISRLMNIISNRRHNISVYLTPELSVYNNIEGVKSNGSKVPLNASINSSSNTSGTNESIRSHPTTAEVGLATDETSTVVIETVPDETPSLETVEVENATRMVVVVDDNIGMHHPDDDEQSDEYSTTFHTTVTASNKPSTNKIVSVSSNDTLTTLMPEAGATVDHKSWENLVQAAPVMAGVLNHTRNQLDKTRHMRSWKTRRGRRKRYIHSIPIELARSHMLATRATTSLGLDYFAYFADVQQFAQLIEIRDDEIQSREALRYLGQYVGPSLFNICDNKNAKSKHVLLFNASRIVISISNFTMDRMMLVLTSAQLPENAGAGRCPPSTLECQITGARVCIDDNSACDGVPNCGANDIYDEDRLECGGASGLQHSVYVAAVSFLGAVLALVYAVYYWLNRCISPVAKAFFVFTHGNENILYLDSIMRSPNDDDSCKMVYHGDLLDEDFSTYKKEHKMKGLMRGFFRKCFACCRHKKDDTQNEDDNIPPRQMYSFTELEIRKMIAADVVDKAIQTGQSLEMSYLDKTKNDKSNKTAICNVEQNQNLDSNKATEPPVRKTGSFQRALELEAIKFTKDAQSVTTNIDPGKRPAMSSRNREQEITLKEKELRSTDFINISLLDSSSASNMTDLPSVMYSGKSECPSHSKKRLRFNEQAMYIPDIREDSEEFSLQRRSVYMGTGRHRLATHGLAIVEPKENPSRGAARDFKRFWGGKKVKKKTHSPKFNK